MKYVMFRKKLKGMDMLVPIIFPNYLVHAHVAAYLTAKGGPLEGAKPDSAGHINSIDLGDATESFCYGESETLNIGSKSERDSKIIMMHDYGLTYDV